MTTVALFIPCYVDQFYPRAAIAALDVLERLGVRVVVPDGAPCCGQPPANAGFEHDGAKALGAFVRTFARNARTYDHLVVLSGSCAMHVRAHAPALGMDGARIGGAVMEYCAFLHDIVGVRAVAALGSSFEARVAVHVGCHALRGLGLASASERQVAPFNKVRALLETVSGVTMAEVQRADECCGFGGSFAVTEPAVSTKMGRDRLRDFNQGQAQAVVSTDLSCLMHLEGLARRDGLSLPMLHVAEVLAHRALT